MKKNGKKQFRRVLSWVLAACVVALLAIMPMLASGTGAAGQQAVLRSAQAERRDIDTRVIGGGQLSGETAVRVELPAEVKLKEYLVHNGDTVREGDAIAIVDTVSVMTAITGVQETLDYLAEQIAGAANTSTTGTVTAVSGGTVKRIYARKGDAVQDVMLANGALAVLSLDDTMAVRLTLESTLEPETAVTVAFADGSTASGKVSSNIGGVLTVTVPDDGYAVGSRVTVQDGAGTVLGAGELYILSPWNVTAYSGTVSEVSVKVGDTLRSGQTIFRLSDLGASADDQQLVDRHHEYEALMQELFRLYRTETLTAPCDGVVTGIDQNGTFMLSADGDAAQVVTLLTGQENTVRLQLLSDIVYEDAPTEAEETESACTGAVDCPASVHREGCLSQQPMPPAAETAILTDSLTPAVAGMPYSFQLRAIPGISGTWAIQGLPAGLTLEPSGGLISGTPEEAGSYAVSVSFVADGASAVREFTLTVSEASGQAVFYGYAAKILQRSGNSVSVMQSPAAYTIADPAQLPDITVDTDSLTAAQTYVSDEFTAFSEGDLVLVVLDEEGSVVKVARLGTTPEPTDPTSPSIPGGGGGGGFPSGGMSGFGGFGGMASGAQSEAFTLYSLEKLTVASVTSQEYMTLEITVDELDITKIHVGQAATVSMDALPGEHFDASVSQVSASGTNEGGNSKFTVELTLAKAEDMLPGMRASAFITLSTAKDVLCVPAAALEELDGQTVVYTGTDPETGAPTAPTPVTLGTADADYVQILDGLPEDAEVYYVGYEVNETVPAAQSFPMPFG